MAKKVCVIGGANVDINATSSAVFRHGDSNPGHVTVSWGGVGRNIAHNLALLGDEVELLTIFGGGIFAPVIAKACSDLGIDTSRCEIAGAGPARDSGKEGCGGTVEADSCKSESRSKANDSRSIANAFFVAVNNCDGELIGGVADMKATDGITPEWLSARIEAINGGEVDGPDAVVVDANVPVEAIAWLIDNCEKPLYIDAVSVAKARKIREAVAASRRKSFFALKCNALEHEALAGLPGPERIYVTAGAKGLRVIAEGQERDFPALPADVRNVTGGGDALLAGIVHMGPEASISESARAGLLCAKCAVESEEAVSPEMTQLRSALN